MEGKAQCDTRRLHLILAAFALTLAVLTVYLPTLDYGFFCLDDDQYVTENSRVIAGLTAESIAWTFSLNTYPYWHPLTWLSHMLDREIYGLNPRGHHLSNLLLHAVNTLLLFFLLRRMTGDLWKSIATAAFFALHPLNAESVVWVASRKTLLSTSFGMLVIWMYSRYAERPRLDRYIFMFLCFGLSLMAKPTLVTLPVILLLLDYWPLSRVRSLHDRGLSEIKATLFRWRNLFLEKLPLLSLSILSIGISLFTAEGKQILVSNETVPLSLRIENGFVSSLSYLYKILCPSDLAFFYAYPLSIPLWQSAGAALLLAVVTGLIVMNIKRFPFLLTGWLWFLIALLPVIGLVQQGLWPAWADRFAYVPMIGVLMMLCWGLPALAPSRLINRSLGAFFCFTILAALAFSTVKQVRYWSDNEGLLKRAIATTDRNHLAHSRLGHLLMEKGRIDEAVFHFSEALRILPENPVFHNDLGTSLLAKGRHQDAVYHLLGALRLSPESPEVLTNLAAVLKQQGKLDEASYYLERSLEIRPIPEAHHNMGLILSEQKRFEEAILHYRAALQFRPGDPRIHSDLGIAFHFAGKREMAFFHLSRAVRLEPNNPLLRHNLEMLGRQDEEKTGADGEVFWKSVGRSGS